MNNSPLVSIVVVTYNSSKYITETLDSIAKQTYNNIEVIISDDFSTDNTTELCENWLSLNKGNFVRGILLKSDRNTGISANLNRGYNACLGEWVKSIAGDDLLLPNAIDDNIKFVQKFPEAKFVFSDRKEFTDLAHEKMRILTSQKYSRNYFYTLSPTDQYWDLVIRNVCIFSCTAFINKDAFLKVGGYDETIPMLEDYPMWIKCTKSGYKMYYFPKQTVLYRVHQESVSHGMGQKKHNVTLFDKSYYLAFMKYCYIPLKSLNKSFAVFKMLYYKDNATSSLLFKNIFRAMRTFIRKTALHGSPRIPYKQVMNDYMSDHLLDIYRENYFNYGK